MRTIDRSHARHQPQRRTASAARMSDAFTQGVTGGQQSRRRAEIAGAAASPTSRCGWRSSRWRMRSPAARIFRAVRQAARLPGAIQPFASGGVIGTPTYFPLRSGGVGLAGEAGPEAIMPLARGPDGRLGVAASGGGRAQHHGEDRDARRGQLPPLRTLSSPARSRARWRAASAGCDESIHDRFPRESCFRSTSRCGAPAGRSGAPRSSRSAPGARSAMRAGRIRGGATTPATASRRFEALSQVVAFFEERRGRLYGFRWRDRLDHSSAAPGVAVVAARPGASASATASTAAFQLREDLWRVRSRPTRGRSPSRSPAACASRSPASKLDDGGFDLSTSTTGVVTFCAGHVRRRARR